MSDEEKSFREDSGDKRWWADMMKDLTLSSMAAVFMTEDAVRNYLREKKLPKELVSLLLEGFARKREDFYGLAAAEVGRFLSKIDVTNELGKFLEKHKIHLEAKISFEPKSANQGEPK